MSEILDYLFEKYCVEGDVSELCDLIKSHDEKLYQQGKTDMVEEVKSEIKSRRTDAYKFLNNDYATGYISALSYLEGFIAQAEVKDDGKTSN